MRTLNKLTSLAFISVLLAGCGSSETTSSGDGGTLTLKAAASIAELEARIKTSLINNYASINNNYSVYTNDVLASSVPSSITASALILSTRPST